MRHLHYPSWHHPALLRPVKRHSHTASHVLRRKHHDEYCAEWTRRHEELLTQQQALSQSGTLAPVQADLEPLGPVLMDGFFEANVSACQMYPIYWQDQPRLLVRGTWFVEAGASKTCLLPLPHAAALVLERAWHSGCASGCDCVPPTSLCAALSFL